MLLLGGSLLAGCNDSRTPTPAPDAGVPSATADQEASPTSTEVEPTPTPEALAARVNGEGLSLAEYEAELERYQAAIGRELTSQDRQLVLDDLIGQMLLAQAAAEQGFTLDEAVLDERLDEATRQAGGAEALVAWLNTNRFSEQQFRQALRRSLAAAWMRDQITAQSAQTADQVHARQLFFTSAEEANQALAELKAGADFETLARGRDALTGGDLGWFPRGVLLHPELDEAVFALQPGQYTDVIQTAIGYHIIQVIERDPQRAPDPQARLKLQAQAVQEWINQRLSQSQVEILAP